MGTKKTFSSSLSLSPSPTSTFFSCPTYSSIPSLVGSPSSCSFPPPQDYLPFLSFPFLSSFPFTSSNSPIAPPWGRRQSAPQEGRYRNTNVVVRPEPHATEGITMSIQIPTIIHPQHFPPHHKDHPMHTGDRPFVMDTTTTTTTSTGSSDNLLDQIYDHNDNFLHRKNDPTRTETTTTSVTSDDTFSLCSSTHCRLPHFRPSTPIWKLRDEELVALVNDLMTKRNHIYTVASATRQLPATSHDSFLARKSQTTSSSSSLSLGPDPLTGGCYYKPTLPSPQLSHLRPRRRRRRYSDSLLLDGLLLSPLSTQPVKNSLVVDDDAHQSIVENEKDNKTLLRRRRRRRQHDGALIKGVEGEKPSLQGSPRDSQQKCHYDDGLNKYWCSLEPQPRVSEQHPSECSEHPSILPEELSKLSKEIPVSSQETVTEGRTVSDSFFFECQREWTTTLNGDTNEPYVMAAATLGQENEEGGKEWWVVDEVGGDKNDTNGCGFTDEPCFLVPAVHTQPKFKKTSYPELFTNHKSCDSVQAGYYQQILLDDSPLSISDVQMWYDATTLIETCEASVGPSSVPATMDARSPTGAGDYYEKMSSSPPNSWSPMDRKLSRPGKPSRVMSSSSLGSQPGFARKGEANNVANHRETTMYWVNDWAVSPQITKKNVILKSPQVLQPTPARRHSCIGPTDDDDDDNDESLITHLSRMKTTPMYGDHSVATPLTPLFDFAMGRRTLPKNSLLRSHLLGQLDPSVSLPGFGSPLPFAQKAARWPLTYMDKRPSLWSLDSISSIAFSENGNEEIERSGKERNCNKRNGPAPPSVEYEREKTLRTDKERKPCLITLTGASHPNNGLSLSETSENRQPNRRPIDVNPLILFLTSTLKLAKPELHHDSTTSAGRCTENGGGKEGSEPFSNQIRDLEGRGKRSPSKTGRKPSVVDKNRPETRPIISPTTQIVRLSCVLPSTNTNRRRLIVHQPPPPSCCIVRTSSMMASRPFRGGKVPPARYPLLRYVGDPPSSSSSLPPPPRFSLMMASSSFPLDRCPVPTTKRRKPAPRSTVRRPILHNRVHYSGGNRKTFLACDSYKPTMMTSPPLCRDPNKRSKKFVVLFHASPVRSDRLRYPPSSHVTISPSQG